MRNIYNIGRLLQFIALAMVVLLVPSCRFFSSDDVLGKRAPAGATAGKTDKKSIVFEEPNLPEPRDTATAETAGMGSGARGTQAGRPRIAIIIDDMGYHQQIGRRLIALDLDLTFSFLPKAPYTRKQEELAWEQGHDVMLHLPMQARSPAVNPGPGALYLHYSRQRIQALVMEDLKSVPHAIGSNNHMGSRFTEDRAAMHEVLAVLKKQGLFFVDSYTTAASTGLDEARKMGIPTARRHVFLDNVQDKKRICRQLDRLVAMALEKGRAIGIGHPHRATLEALTACGPTVQSRVQLVGIHALVR